MSQVPLIWTIKGNLPVSDLKHEVEWRVAPEHIVFIERYLLAGEIVKESSHVKLLIGATADGATAI